MRGFGVVSWFVLSGLACGEVTATPDAANVSADAGGQVEADPVSVDARIACDEGFTGPPTCADCTVYVSDEDGSNSQPGRSWDDAVETVTAGINRAVARVEAEELDHCAVWVREGTYVPGQHRQDSFELAPGVHLYGGFAGFEDARDERNFRQYETILSGDLEGNDDPNDEATFEDNAYHVVVGADDATLDGFTVTAGHADSDDQEDGAGIYLEDASPTLRNLVFTHNLASGGGGAIASLGDSAPILKNVKFKTNEALHGGALYAIDSSEPIVINAIFLDNDAGFGGGAMMSGSSSAPSLINVSLHDNEAGLNGGAIRNVGAAGTTIVNGILWGNEDGDGDEIYHNSDVALEVRASVVEGDVNDIDGDGTLVTEGIIDQDPRFVSAPDDLRLQSSSPAIDAGDGSIVDEIRVDFPDYDLAGEPRFVDGEDGGEGFIDIGAYEFQPE